MYLIRRSPKVVKIFEKLAQKNPRQLESIMKKLDEVAENPHRFKPLSNIMKGFRRVHFGSFVLTFTIDELRKIVSLEDYDHHDNIYNK